MYIGNIIAAKLLTGKMPDEQHQAGTRKEKPARRRRI
jgi:hypothetical protein